MNIILTVRRHLHFVYLLVFKEKHFVTKFGSVSVLIWQGWGSSLQDGTEGGTAYCSALFRKPDDGWVQKVSNLKYKQNNFGECSQRIRKYYLAVTSLFRLTCMKPKQCPTLLLPKGSTNRQPQLSSISSIACYMFQF